MRRAAAQAGIPRRWPSALLAASPLLAPGASRAQESPAPMAGANRTAAVLAALHVTVQDACKVAGGQALALRRAWIEEVCACPDLGAVEGHPRDALIAAVVGELEALAATTQTTDAGGVASLAAERQAWLMRGVVALDHLRAPAAREWTARALLLAPDAAIDHLAQAAFGPPPRPSPERERLAQALREKLGDPAAALPLPEELIQRYCERLFAGATAGGGARERRQQLEAALGALGGKVAEGTTAGRFVADRSSIVVLQHHRAAAGKGDRETVPLQHPVRVRTIAVAGKAPAPIHLWRARDEVTFLALLTETYLLTLADEGGAELQVVLAPSDACATVDGFATERIVLPVGDEYPRGYVLVRTGDGSRWWVSRDPIPREALRMGASTGLRRALDNARVPSPVQMSAPIMRALVASQRTDLALPTEAVEKILETAQMNPFAVPPGAFIAHTTASYAAEGSTWVVFDTFPASQ